MLSIEWTIPAGTTEVLEFDAVTNEDHEQASDITEHSVEHGAAISDHARPQSKHLTIEAWVTNQPIEMRRYGANGVTLTPRATDGKPQLTTLQASSEFDRVQTVDDVLQVLQNTPELLVIRTARRVYDNVVIERYKMTRDAESGLALHVQLDLRRVRIVETQTVPVTAPVQRRGQRNQQRGNQATEDNRTLAARLADTGPARSVGRFLGVSQ